MTPAICYGCSTSLPPGEPTARLCPPCSEQQYESLARALDPAYDPEAANDWEECEAVLRRLYGPPWDRWTAPDCWCRCGLCVGEGGE